jgi:dienelactone hydrolase
MVHATMGTLPCNEDRATAVFQLASARSAFACARETARRHFHSRRDGLQALGYFMRELWYFARGCFPSGLDDRPRAGGRDGVRVLVIPGLMADDRGMLPLRLALRARGYRVYRWKLGRNNGATADMLDRVDARIRDIQRRDSAPIVLVGWSLGGLIAREYAKIAPQRVAAVISLASPFSGDISATLVARVYKWVAGHSVSALPIACNLSEKPPVPTVTIWSPCDGVIPAPAARGAPDESDHQIEIACAHMTFPRSRAAHEAICDAVQRCCPSGERKTRCSGQRQRTTQSTAGLRAGIAGAG